MRRSDYAVMKARDELRTREDNVTAELEIVASAIGLG
jgi:hypothetical protein